MVNDRLVAIASAGIQAPSADNRHVFQLSFENDMIHLWQSEEFSGCTEPHRKLLGWISIGAVLENMQLMARALGADLQIQLFTTALQGPVAQATVVAGELPSKDLMAMAAAIGDRRTNRRMYKGPGLSADEKGALNAAVGDRPDKVSLAWLYGENRRHALQLVWMAESERFLRQALHHELFSSIRFDLSWNDTATDRLPPAALEVEMPMRPLFKALRHWPVMNAFAKLGGHRLLGLRAGWLPCWQAPELGVLTVALDQPLPLAAIDVGMAMQRLWLRATHLGLAMQPMAASAILAFAEPGPDGIRAYACDGLNAGWQKVFPSARPMILFRLGRAQAPGTRAGRPPLSDLMRPT